MTFEDRFPGVFKDLSMTTTHVERFTSHVNLHTLLPAQQSAYRPFHSTETAVLSVHNDLVRAVDDCRVSQLVLLDLSAAFDTVDRGPPGFAVRAV